MVSIHATTIPPGRLAIYLIVVIPIRLLHLDPWASASCHTFHLREEFILAKLVPILRRKVVIAVGFVQRGWRKRSPPKCVLPL